MRRLLSRMMPLLLAGAFMALPASTAPVCDPHEHYACAPLHMELYDTPYAGLHDPVSHEHGLHVHGSCHVPMTRPEAFELSTLIDEDSVSWPFNDHKARSGAAVALERPPRT